MNLFAYYFLIVKFIVVSKIRLLLVLFSASESEVQAFKG